MPSSRTPRSLPPATARSAAASALEPCPGDAADSQAHYLEAAISGVIVACLYLPNGNPQPSPKFDYKLA